MNNFIAVEDNRLSKNGKARYVIVDKETGEVLDDAQGYGYKSKPKAYAGYAYIIRDKSRDQEKLARREQIRQWMKTHKNFGRTLETYAFEIAEGSWGPGGKVDAALVKKVLEELEYEVDFTAGELLRVWEKW